MRAVLLVVVLAAIGCGRSDSASVGGADDTIDVCTTFYPTTFFVEQIGGDLVDVECVTPDDVDPLHWRPDRDEVAELQDADLIVLHGAGLEQWAEQVSLPESRVVIASKPISDELIHTGTTTHSHGPAGAHTHGEIDPHTWLDPLNALELAGAIHDAMGERYSDDAGTFDSGLQRLDNELRAIDATLRELDMDNVTILCSHPAYNYLARRYGWAVINFDLDPGAELSDEAFSAIGADADGADTVVMLWESTPLDSTVTRLADELGVVSVVFSPCETTPDEGDYITVMQGNVQRLSDALSD